MEDGFRGGRSGWCTSAGIVLILVLVEDGFREPGNHLQVLREGGLNPCSCGRWLQSELDVKEFTDTVLILVLVEDGFRGDQIFYYDFLKGLNPCSCGRWLQSSWEVHMTSQLSVLILVLVEDGFRV